MDEAKKEVGKVTLPYLETVGWHPTELTLHCKCVLCGSDSEMKIPNGTPVNGFMPPYVCDKCKEFWKKLSERVNL